MHTRTAVIPLATFALMALPAWAGAIDYNFQTIVYPNDTFTQLLGINDSGVIAGYHGAGTNANNPNKGFTYSNGNFTSENFPNSVQTQVTGINNSGETAGFYIDSGGLTHGFTDVSGTFTSLDDPSGVGATTINGLGNSGLAAGFFVNGSGNNEAFLYNPANQSFLNFSPFSSTNAQATSVNGHAEVVGFYTNANNVVDGFTDINNVLATVVFPGATMTQIFGVADNGQLVGQYTDVTGVQHGFVDIGGNFITVDDPLGMGTTTINGVNNLNELVGFYVDGNGATDGFLATAAPEPLTSALCGAGLLLLGAGFRKRRR